MELRLERPSTSRDYEQWAEILKQVSGDIVDVDEIAHFVETDGESAWLLATNDEEAAGCGVGRPSSIQSNLYAMVRVLAERRRQGIGSRIYAAVSDHARRLGRDSMWGRILEGDEESRSFARNRGFREAGREYEVVLDAAGRASSPILPTASSSSRSPSGPTSRRRCTRSTARCRP